MKSTPDSGQTGLASIVIPTYYRNEQLEDTLKSAFHQTYEDIEVVVVDDSGESHAQDMEKKYDIEYISHEENRGAQAARETGVRAASGRFIQLLDDDDRLHPKKLELQIPLLEENEDVGVVYSGVERGGVRLKPNSEFRGDVLREALVFNHYPCYTATMLTERSLLHEIMPFTRHTKDEVGMIIALANLTQFDYVDEILVTKGAHQNHRGMDPSFSREGIGIVNDYDHLYRRYPDEIRYKALQHQYRRYAHSILQNEVWSHRAVLAAGQSLYWGLRSNNVDVKTALLPIVALLGNVGYRTLLPVYQKLQN